jgi:Na+-driven multidrug efflux pump
MRSAAAVVNTVDEAMIRYGASYLRVSAIVLAFVTLNLLASRTLTGADDTRVPILIRASGAVTNVGLNALFIFGLGMGLTGAALGTVIV